MQAVSTSPFNLSMLRKRNVWYTVKDGNWSDPTIWMGNGAKRHSLPQVGDDVYVNNGVTLDLATIHVHHLYIAGSINTTATPVVSITVDGDCQVSGNGTINLPLQFHNLILNGYNNIIPYAAFNSGSYSSVTYNGFFDQTILNIPYNNLSTQNGNKSQADSISIGGSFNMQSNYECGNYNLSVTGSSTIGTVGAYKFSKSGLGNLLFVGNVDFEGTTDLSIGNPNIEFRSGLTIHTFNFTSGTGTITFSTNNQTISVSAYLGGAWNAPIVIKGAITVTLSGGDKLVTNSTINGTSAGSTFNNEGVLWLAYNSTPMATGAFNYMHTTTSTLGYVFNGEFTLPYSTFANLYIAGTGIKTLSANTTVNNFDNEGTFEFGGYNFSCSGTFTNGGIGPLTANAFCIITVTGLVFFNSNGTSYVDFSVGNPNIEFRGGWSIHSYGVNTGTGIFKFNTNNQNIDFTAYIAGTFSCNILVSGAITVTFITTSPAGTIPLIGTLNGDDSSSTFVNKGLWYYASAQQPMQTGVLNCNAATNTFVYYLNGGQDITAGTYRNLTLVVGGAKKLMGNVSVVNTYTLTSPATLNSNGFVLTNP
jgi:hypothetical protein